MNLGLQKLKERLCQNQLHRDYLFVFPTHPSPWLTLLRDSLSAAEVEGAFGAEVSSVAGTSITARTAVAEVWRSGRGSLAKRRFPPFLPFCFSPHLLVFGFHLYHDLFFFFQSIEYGLRSSTGYICFGTACAAVGLCTNNHARDALLRHRMMRDEISGGLQVWCRAAWAPLHQIFT